VSTRFYQQVLAKVKELVPVGASVYMTNFGTASKLYDNIEEQRL